MKQIRAIYNYIRKRLSYLYYRANYNRILTSVRRKDVKKVCFFVIDLSMWKGNSLFEKLLKDPEFDPYIISFVYPIHSKETQKHIQDSIRAYFFKKKFPYIDGYNFEENKCFDFKAFRPDIVFYAQPYNVGYDDLKLQRVWHNSLFAYIPYCINLENNPIYYSGLYQNICWKSYCATEFNKSFESKLLFNKGKNMVVVGHPLFNELEDCKDCCDNWKTPRGIKKRFIWAPHHSILPGELGYSNFLQIADDVLSLAEKYCDQIEIAFKPHPMLKDKLYSVSEWGVKRTDRYYEKWEHLPNTILAEGPYVHLFMTSDAMFHDSASFTYEYLYTCKPVMYIVKDVEAHKKQLNDLGIKCFNLHYHGSSIFDIETFINNTIQGIDILHNKRVEFKENVLSQKGKDVYDIIYEDIKKSLSNK